MAKCELNCGECQIDCSFKRLNAFDNASGEGVNLSVGRTVRELTIRGEAKRRVSAGKNIPHPGGGGVWPPLGELGK